MGRLELITDPKKLKAKSKKVSIWKGFKVAKKLVNFIIGSDIKCVGLAAPQLAINQRVFILMDKENYAAFINPRIIEVGAIEEEAVERCLSIPGRAFKVKRPTSIIVKDAVRTKPFELTGISARAWLHEYDHLRGVLISDIGEEVAEE